MSGPTVDGVDLGDLNYTVQAPYNETIPTGGNSLIQDLNIHYNVRRIALSCDNHRTVS